ncbi:hypothetical protein ACUHMQ_18130 [Chitinimonas sp. PSY-7]|uniref:hypothetical protein n=1 Tax=Chitinimonas sp. PSY-7 TaxID=3459088 RepID=UPI0040402E5C
MSCPVPSCIAEQALRNQELLVDALADMLSDYLRCGEFSPAYWRGVAALAHVVNVRAASKAGEKVCCDERSR